MCDSGIEAGRMAARMSARSRMEDGGWAGTRQVGA